MLGTLMDERLNENLKPLGLTLSQFAIIMVLLEEDGLTQVEIGRRALLPGYATSRHLDKLESSGYLQRQHHETSRRSHRIVLTDSGKALAPELFRATQITNDHFMSPLREGQKSELLNILKELARKHGLPARTK